MNLKKTGGLLTKACFALSFLVMRIAVQPCQASPKPVETKPHVFPLHFVSWLDNGPVAPEIALKASFVAYPDLPSYKQYLDADENSPERAIARYIQALSDGQEQSTLTPETLATAKVLYSEDEKKSSETVIEEQIKEDHRVISSTPDIRMWHRYDAGPLTVITLAYISPLRVQPFLTLYLRSNFPSYFITTYKRGYRHDEPTDPLNIVLTLNESHLVRRPNLADVPQPNYLYGFSLRTSVPAVTSNANPVEVVFNGKVSDVLVDEKMVPADPVQAFVKRAVLTYHTGNLQQFLALWTDYDVKGIFARRLAVEPNAKIAFIPPSDLGTVAAQEQPRIVFTIDCDVEALVFLRTGDSKELHLLVVWKQAPGNYRLSESGELTNHETALPGNLRPFFNSLEFQSYVSGMVDQFTREVAPHQPSRENK